MKDCHLTKDEILEHYGYDPILYRVMPIGLWKTEDVYKNIQYLESYMNMTGNRKVRVILDFDPNFPRSMFRVEQIPDITESSE